MPTPDDVARWMIKELEESRHEYLNHHSAALGIQEKFGDEFVYINKAGALLST